MDTLAARPPPYDNLIDDETWAFIDATNACYPADAVELTLSRQRELYNAMCATFHQGRPANVLTQDFNAGSTQTPVREYRLQSDRYSQATVIYYHGGGFVVGGLDSHDDICAEICAATGYIVYACDYRLAPEHIHPAAFEDAWALFEWVCSSHSRQPGSDSAGSHNIVLAGDSAGATLAAAIAAHTRGSGSAPAGQVLVYPYLGGPTDQGSAIVHAQAPMLSTDDLLFYHQVRSGGIEPDPDDSRFAPLWAGRFDALPPSVIFSAECDPLCDDGEHYAHALKQAGGKAQWIKEPGLVHGYLRARSMSTRAAGSFAAIKRAISALGRNHWPY